MECDDATMPCLESQAGEETQSPVDFSSERPSIIVGHGAHISPPVVSPDVDVRYNGPDALLSPQCSPVLLPHCADSRTDPCSTLTPQSAVSDASARSSPKSRATFRPAKQIPVAEVKRVR